MPSTQRVTILLGCSGSGKSTWAEKARDGCSWPLVAVLSADAFFINKDTGVYQFEPAKLASAHASCLRNYVGTLQSGCDHIIVDNTNTSLVELAPYVALAQAYGASLRLLAFVPSDTTAAHARCVHGVPLSTVLRQDAQLGEMLAKFPPWWPQPEIVVR